MSPVHSERPKTYLIALEHVADHLRRLLDVGSVIGGQDSPPGHQDHQVTDVSDVGDGPQGMVHHYLLATKPKLTTCTRMKWVHNQR